MTPQLDKYDIILRFWDSQGGKKENFHFFLIFILASSTGDKGLHLFTTGGIYPVEDAKVKNSMKHFFWEIFFSVWSFEVGESSTKAL